MRILLGARGSVDARGRLERMPVPSATPWPAGTRELYQAFLRWLEPHGVPAARARTTLVAVRHLLARLTTPLDLMTVMEASTTLLLEYDARGAAPGTLQQFRSALRVFQRFVAVRTGAPLTVSARPPTPEWYLAGLPTWRHPRLLEYITVQSRGWRLAVRRPRAHALARHLARLLSFQLASAPMMTWAGLTRKGIEAWVDQRLASGRKPRTVASDVALLRSFWTCLVEVAEIDRSPLQRPLAILLSEMLPRFVPDDIVARLSAQRDMAIAQARTGYQRRQALRERAVVYLLVDSGLRRSEVVGLTLDDVDLPGRRLCVRHAQLQRDRLVYLRARAVRALREYLTVREAAATDRLLVRMGLPLTEASLGGCVQRWGAQWGISLSPHRVRHTYATRLLTAGMPVASLQKTLGHRSLDKTVLYARVADPVVEGEYYRALAVLEARGDQTGEGLMAESVRRQLLRLVDQLLQAPLPEEERERLLRQMRDLLEPPPEITAPRKEDQKDQS